MALQLDVANNPVSSLEIILLRVPTDYWNWLTLDLKLVMILLKFIFKVYS